MNAQRIIQAIATVKNRIADYEKKYHRVENSVKLIAVTKTKTVADIQQALAANIVSFGENYLQEALPKIQALAQEKIEWHFIGHMQSNKTKFIAENFSWAQSIDQFKIAQRLNAQRPVSLPRLNCLIQVNIDDESTKSGVDPSNLFSLAEQLITLPQLHFRGLMSIPKPHTDFNQQRTAFKKVQQLFSTLQQKGFAIDTLSMGMSNDFEAAIAEGSTMVRLGTALFGAR